MKIKTKHGDVLFEFAGDTLVGAQLEYAYLNYAYLRDKNLQDANFKNAYLYGVDFRDANLSGADMRGAYLCKADLRGAKLDGVLINDMTQISSATKLDPEHLTYLLLKGIKFSKYSKYDY